MEVHFTPLTEAQLKQFAERKGKNVSQVVEETISDMLARRALFLEAVDRGIASADRGDLIDHDDVVNQMNRLLHS